MEYNFKKPDMATKRKTPEQSTVTEQSTSAGNSGDQTTAAESDGLACLGADLLRRAEESQPILETAWDDLLASWGIHGEPTGVERLRSLIQKESGTTPDDNSFSRELIESREERRS